MDQDNSQQQIRQQQILLPVPCMFEFSLLFILKILTF